MNVIKPTPSQAAFVLKNFLKAEGIDIKLGQTQEAVARMLGYSSWNALASEVDPRIGDKEGCLHQEDETTYTLTTGAQSYAYINVNNLQVSIKHDDEGVCVDVFARQPIEGEVGELGSTWVMFDEAIEFDEAAISSESIQIIANHEGGVCPDCGEDIPKNVKSGDTCTNCGHAFFLSMSEDGDDSGPARTATTGDALAKLLITANAVTTSEMGGNSYQLGKDLPRLKAYVAGSAFLEKTDVLAYVSGKYSWCIRVSDLDGVSPLGEHGWLLPDGTELWVYQPK